MSIIYGHGVKIRNQLVRMERADDLPIMLYDQLNGPFQA